MKCEICHKADAATVLHRKGKDGVEEELYVCRDCAAQASAKGKPKASTAKKAPGAQVSFDGEEPPPFVENFVKAALGLVEGIAEKEKGKKSCPGCGYTWDQIKTERRVGCPRCYRTFAELIRGEFFQGAYGPTHVGEMPATGTPEAETRAVLERELKRAVKNQQFEKAAEIRRKLDRLKGDDAPSRGTASKEDK